MTSGYYISRPCFLHNSRMNVSVVVLLLSYHAFANAVPILHPRIVLDTGTLVGIILGLVEPISVRGCKVAFVVFRSA
jgi:hypothetical protein